MDIEISAVVARLSAQEMERARLLLLWHNSTDSGEVFDIAGWTLPPWKAAVFLVASWESGLVFAVLIMLV